MNLLVDVGNTRIKWGLDDEGKLIIGAAVVHKQSGFCQALTQQWQALKSPIKMVFAASANVHTCRQIIAVAQTLWPKITITNAESSAYAFSVSNAYPQPEKMGVDRWLNLIALHHHYRGNNCVVDCGTAITIDCINDSGQHLGGLIGVGIHLMQQTLYAHTNMSPMRVESCPVALANNTESAIYSGALYASSGLIEKTLNDLCMCDTVVLTGGDAPLIAPYLKMNCVIDVDFVLKGLLIYSGGSFK